MMTTTETKIFVYAHWQELDNPQLMGVLNVQQTKGRTSFSFEYDKSWLAQKNRLLLDPDLAFYSGPQYSTKKENFGVFLDSMPDTWGRTLMQRKASLQFTESSGKRRLLNDLDYLLGVSDTCRMGALRYKLDPDGPFLSDDSSQPVPPWTSVGELQHVAAMVESDKKSKQLNKWLAVLMAPGSSLGGARPKANIMDQHGHFWIAKFPSKNDTFDKAKWEFLSWKLALASGIIMSDSSISKVAGKHHTFFTKRFDRNKKSRIHFSSAMTMTGNNENTVRDQPASYLDIALFIQSHCANPVEDLRQLWTRIVFNIAVSNTDDHLRNHGFILKNNSWHLSPAFDINPSIDKTGLSLNIDEANNDLDFDLAMSVIEYFRLEKKQALEILMKVRKVVSKWENVAKNTGISRNEISLLKNAFRF